MEPSPEERPPGTPRWGRIAVGVVLALVVYLVAGPMPEVLHDFLDDVPESKPASQPEVPESSSLPKLDSTVPAALTSPSDGQQPVGSEGSVPRLSPDAPNASVIVNTAIGEVGFTLRDFRTAHGGNPVGTNAEITKALMGDNFKQLKLPIPQGSTLNEKGELCDPFGTPYFFHQLSKDQMEVRSAGADRQLWTADDIVGQ
jgi:hypothetical protein